MFDVSHVQYIMYVFGRLYVYNKGHLMPPNEKKRLKEKERERVKEMVFWQRHIIVKSLESEEKEEKKRKNNIGRTGKMDNEYGNK